MKITIVLSFLILSNLAQGNTLKLNLSDKKLAETTLASSASFNESLQLQSVGAGVRNKKVVFVNVDVYIAQLFVNNVSAFDKANPLNSILNQPAAAITLTFLREVDSEKIMNSFIEAFHTNSINEKDSDVADFLQAIKKSGALQKGQTLAFINQRTHGVNKLTFENPSTTSNFENAPNLSAKVFAIWLSKPADSGIEKLQKELLK